ncbi:malto-oligosyltrehalose trehalohydrolase [Variovorax sp. J22P168]|uniref:malto-oligosyltrehalose trehalohydrolase n=1 Tax=Variovorax jilinensis TaxID=3053513 RepID=UPI002576276B|nr:malto-oligosyltrehalose trehalohydrolase [Variovorax sp. J22P168]MDM0013295.1 malto-oligosyltrehalose trehalohydrolase [Variovorax sp. J22P168]
MKRVHAMPFGAELLEAGGVRFRLWAPSLPQVVLELARGDGDGGSWQDHAMQRLEGGWHEATLPHAAAGDRYRLRLPDGLRVPDPASRRNPDDVHGPSEVVDPRAHDWTDDSWTGRPWNEAVVYELHLGTFTPQGTLAAAGDRLADLAELGITAVELMPIADFPGRRNWGYDGVLPFAPDTSYGTPEDLKCFVERAHGLGLMVLLDVVYNHFGPEGNYLHACCPEFFNAAHQTPWGAAINFDGPEARTVRDFFVHNALYWIEEYGFDGLRLDAVHAIRDDSRPGIVEEICSALRQGPGRLRQVHVVLENDLNEAHRLERDAEGEPLAATAQWNDDLHHAAHVLLTGEADGYYADYAQRPIEQFGLALAQGFIYSGQPSDFRGGEPRGEPCTHLPLGAFVSFLQTHDQVGNRAFGERIDALADPARLLAARSCVLLSPHTPMLFMGEEYAATTPFQFFCDFGPELAAAVTAGRRSEFGRFASFGDQAAQARIPDPNDEATFAASRLDSAEREAPTQAQALALTRELLRVRRVELTPRFGAGCRTHQWSCEGDALRLVWQLDAPGTDADGAPDGKVPQAFLHLVANFGRGDAELAWPPGRVIHLRHGDASPAPGNMLRLASGGVCAALEEFVDG